MVPQRVEIDIILMSLLTSLNCSFNYFKTDIKAVDMKEACTFSG